MVGWKSGTPSPFKDDRHYTTHPAWTVELCLMEEEATQRKKKRSASGGKTPKQSESRVRNELKYKHAPYIWIAPRSLAFFSRSR